jgi:hypothetical protein
VDRIVRCRRVSAGMFPDDCRVFVRPSIAYIWNWQDLYILSPPPGCSGANSVMSQTLPSTTIQQSSGVLCLEISSTEIKFPSAIFVLLANANGQERMPFREIIAFEPPSRRPQPSLLLAAVKSAVLLGEHTGTGSSNTEVAGVPQPQGAFRLSWRMRVSAA